MIEASYYSEVLIHAGCLKFSVKKPFKYASGLIGPIYCDNRSILSQVITRAKILEGYVDLLQSLTLNEPVIAGVATGGIPMGAILAHQEMLPFVYVRPKAKEHGKGKVIEGGHKENDSLVLIEDLVNQGASLKKVCDLLDNEKVNIAACLCIVDYMTQASLKYRDESGIKILSLTNFSNLIQTAKAMGKVTQEELESLESWHKDPQAWSVAHS